MHVVLLAKGTGGDVLPYMGLAHALQQRGHAATIITHCHYRDMARAAGIGFAALDTREEYEEFLTDLVLVHNGTRSTAELLDLARRRTRAAKRRSWVGEYELLKAHHVPGDTVYIGPRHVDYHALMIAEQLRAPLVWLLNSLQEVTMPPLPHELDCAHTRMLNILRAEIGLPAIASWTSWRAYASLTLAAWPAWFAADLLASWPEITPVGFLLGDRFAPDPIPPEIQESLCGAVPPVLITGGSSKRDAGIYAACVEACAALGYPSILVSPYREHLPARLPANVIWCMALPFARVMPRVRAVIHHGGLGTLAGALLAGVPQLALASENDRPENARRLAALGAGLHLPPSVWEPRQVAEALRLLSTSQEIRRRCSDLAAMMRAIDPGAEASRLIEGLLPA